jgi:hypothetical protein
MDVDGAPLQQRVLEEQEHWRPSGGVIDGRVAARDAERSQLVGFAGRVRRCRSSDGGSFERIDDGHWVWRPTAPPSA